MVVKDPRHTQQGQRAERGVRRFDHTSLHSGEGVERRLEIVGLDDGHPSGKSALLNRRKRPAVAGFPGLRQHLLASAVTGAAHPLPGIHAQRRNQPCRPRWQRHRGCTLGKGGAGSLGETNRGGDVGGADWGRGALQNQGIPSGGSGLSRSLRRPGQFLACPQQPNEERLSNGSFRMTIPALSLQEPGRQGQGTL